MNTKKVTKNGSFTAVVNNCPNGLIITKNSNILLNRNHIKKIMMTVFVLKPIEFYRTELIVKQAYVVPSISFQTFFVQVFKIVVDS